LKEQPNPIEAFTKYDYEFIKKQLQGYLNPGEEVAAPAEPTEAVAPVAAPTPAPVAPSIIPGTGIMEEKAFSMEAATVGKQNTVSKFDDLFS
jgi:hypothetical protein